MICGIKHTKWKLWISRIQLSHPYASQHFEGVLESVVNCIPWRRKNSWMTNREFLLADGPTMDFCMFDYSRKEWVFSRRVCWNSSSTASLEAWRGERQSTSILSSFHPSVRVHFFAHQIVCPAVHPSIRPPIRPPASISSSIHPSFIHPSVHYRICSVIWPSIHPH